MRRSKSNPAKYARNYRKISQRRMTSTDRAGDADGIDSEEKEMERLKELIRSSSAHLSRVTACDSDDDGNSPRQGKKTMKRKHEDNGKDDKDDITACINAEEEEQEPQYTIDDTPDILPSRKRTKNKPAPSVTLTPLELKKAKQEHKNNQRKLLQLQQRKEQKSRRMELYSTLKQNSITKEEMGLMERTAHLGKKVSKRELVGKLLKKERAGITLQDTEKSVLYTTITDHGDSDDVIPAFIDSSVSDTKKESYIKDNGDDEVEEVVPLPFPSKKKKKKKSARGDSSPLKGVTNKENDTNTEGDTSNIKTESISEHISTAEKEVLADNSIKEKARQVASAEGYNDECTSHNSDNEDRQRFVKFNNKEEKDSMINSTSTPSLSPCSFAEQMMAGLTTLKSQSQQQTIKLQNKAAQTEAIEQENRQRQDEEEKKKQVKYVPKSPAVLKTAATLGLSKDSTKESKRQWRVLPVDRPEHIALARYDLPVSSMEYEIVDSVRNHPVTILCGETGSGKSTQVPQFLYESGFSLGNAKKEGEDDGLLIGITQPRRVAAVSTAKRVCFEMGFSSSKNDSNDEKGKGVISIPYEGKGRGNVVAYQTRYETAGLGSKTRIKFMTDGILLQEIRSDLLLRKYAVVVLDEAHERNLNTDVLLGLLSIALPLRRKAAEEGSLPPLKVVVMSATLKVEEFTDNGRLFHDEIGGEPSLPNLVKVPGRTFPVTIHHSKVTELDDYEGVALKKICRIHRKLPPGGILVFLTGKQEIVRMVNRLRKLLVPRVKGKEFGKKFSGAFDVQISAKVEDENVSSDGGKDGEFRDMDDEEADGDLFQKNDRHDDYESCDEDDIGSNWDQTADKEDKGRESDEHDNMPENVLILPLYSLLSVQEQAKVFSPVPEGTRLIVIATNIAETSITIPGISYVVDTGRQKCRNYHAGTGVASYDVMWISKASADQRAGRAGRTGPGHCYRLYSSSLYSRHLDPFALPEVLTRPLEDIVLAMKSMGVKNIEKFPFPTAPDSSQIKAAVKMLANIGCLDLSGVARDGGDGVITKLGIAIAKIPLGVRYGKILLISAQANVLDYGIAMVAVLSESSPFTEQPGKKADREDDEAGSDDEIHLDVLDEVDRNQALEDERQKHKERSSKWIHKSGDILAGMLAAGAYAYAGRGAGGVSENFACRKFCEENGLHFVIMQRIHKMRIHLARLVKQRLCNADGVAMKTGGILSSMSPPNKLQENLLKQAIISGFLDNVARRSPPGLLTQGKNLPPRASFSSCRSLISEPLFIDKKSVLFSKDYRQLPEWVCYDVLVRKTKKDGSTISTMRNVTPVDPSWLGTLAEGSQLLFLGNAIKTPVPRYDSSVDAIVCSVETKYGNHGWMIPPLQVAMKDVINTSSKHAVTDDSFHWFARYLLEGKVFGELKDLSLMLNDDPAIITRKKPVKKVALLVSALSNKGIDSADRLKQHWSENDNKFLFKNMKEWTKCECSSDLKTLWIHTVKKCIKNWKSNGNI